jgi:DNA polymerase-3 subunit alpha
LEKYRGGKCRVAIHYLRPEAKANLNLGDTWRIRPTDNLITLLNEMFTEQDVEVVY